MRYYSKKHYSLVSPHRDTDEQIKERILHKEACVLAHKDCLEKYGQITVENAKEAIKYQDERIKHHMLRIAL